MDADKIEKFLKKFKWNTIQKMYGHAHSSIIGFLSAEWINQYKLNSVLDGVPTATKGEGRKGQRHADILLSQGDEFYAVIEVETCPWHFRKKIASLSGYLQNKKDLKGIRFGLLVVMGYLPLNEKRRKNYWASIWNPIKEKVKKGKSNIAIVFIEKSKLQSNSSKSPLSKLREGDDYFRWDIEKIHYWINDKNKGIFWEKKG